MSQAQKYHNHFDHPDDMLVRVIVKFPEDVDGGWWSQTYLFRGGSYKTRDISIAKLTGLVQKALLEAGDDVLIGGVDTDETET